jgi:uncharacterized damage-inducible protein DinB
MTLEEVRILFDYDCWANHRVLDACAALTEEQFLRELGGSFASVRGTLVHVLGCEWVWLERWRGRSPSALWPVEQFPSLTAVRVRWGEVERDLRAFLDGLAPADVDRQFDYRTTSGAASSNPFWQMFQHFANHGSYHRGQVTTLLRQLGAKPAATDLIVFYRERGARAGA